jgi:hypothetical protein
MKKQLNFTLLIIVALAAVLLNLSCSGTPQNNTAENFAADVCSGNPLDKPEKIKKKVKENIERDDRLKYQYESCQNSCRRERFFFEPVKETDDDVTLYIWGSIYISEKDDLDNLHKKYKDYFKKGCVANVVYTSPPQDITESARILEFSASCEAPNRICDDGTCREDCVK